MSSPNSKSLLETLVSCIQAPPREAVGDACLVHIYPRGPGMGARHKLADKPLVIGRGPDCEIRIEDHSVSRRHACIHRGPRGFLAEDLESTNGTFVNDAPVETGSLKDGDYLRTGNCIFRFLAGGNLESAYHEEIYRLTIIDALTGVHNKRYLLEFLERELSRSARYKRPVALVLFDLDHFKRVNDEHGHLAGDCVLRELAAVARTVIRTEELLARYGGEEFAVVLPEATVEGAAHQAERMRALVEGHAFPIEGAELRLTISLGVVGTDGERDWSAQDLIHLADRKLYQSKKAGRTRVSA